ncbi:MAG: glycosyltransferase [Candidatus Aenigmatarchaeota archaeon]
MHATIGITANNEENNIGKLLAALSGDRYNFILDEIVVVSSSSDRTDDIVRESAEKNRKIRLIVEKPRKGKSSAINKILDNSKSDVVVLVCGDNIPGKGSINALVEKFKNGAITAASGRPMPLEKKGLFGYISHLIWSMHHYYCTMEPKVSGELCAIRKSAIKRIPEKIINDDGYITAMMRKKGRIAYVPRAITYMTGKNSFWTHMRRRRRIARGYMQLKAMGMNVSIPEETIRNLVIEEIRKEPINTVKIIAAVAIEIIINILASYDTIRGNTPYIWKR